MSFRKDITFITLIVLLLVWVVLVFYLWQSGFQHLALSPHALREYLAAYGKWSVLAYIVIYIIDSLVPFPPTFGFAIAAGFIFGPWKGALYLYTGVIIATQLAFFISRKAGRKAIQHLLGDKIAKIEKFIERNGFASVLILRVTGIVPYEILNYASGLTSVRLRDYFWGTFLGSIPGVLLSVNLGNELGEAKTFSEIFSPTTAILVLTLFMLPVVAFKFLRKKYQNTKIN